jgi:hypothetical protein
MSSLTANVNYSSNSIASSNNMSIFLSFLVTYQGHYTPTLDLEYASKDPSSIQFGNAKHIQPIVLWPLKLEDEHSDEDKSILLPSDSLFNEVYPAQVCIKIEEFEETHNAREVKAKNQQATDLNNQGKHLICQLNEQLIKELSTTVEEAPEVLVNVPSNIHWSLNLLYKVLCTKFDPSQVANADDNDSFTVHSLG